MNQTSQLTFDPDLINHYLINRFYLTYHEHKMNPRPLKLLLRMS